MGDYTPEDSAASVRHLLEAAETIRAVTRARDAVLALTDRRLIVAANDRVTLDIPIDGVRRVQFDIERARPATLVIVPKHPAAEPQVLAIPPEEYRRAASVLATLGEQLAELDWGGPTDGR